MYPSAQPLVVICLSLKPQHQPMDPGATLPFLNLSAGISTSIFSRSILVTWTVQPTEDISVPSGLRVRTLITALAVRCARYKYTNWTEIVCYNWSSIGHKLVWQQVLERNWCWLTLQLLTKSTTSCGSWPSLSVSSDCSWMSPSLLRSVFCDQVSLLLLGPNSTWLDRIQLVLSCRVKARRDASNWFQYGRRRSNGDRLY